MLQPFSESPCHSNHPSQSAHNEYRSAEQPASQPSRLPVEATIGAALPTTIVPVVTTCGHSAKRQSQSGVCLPGVETATIAAALPTIVPVVVQGSNAHHCAGQSPATSSRRLEVPVAMASATAAATPGGNCCVGVKEIRPTHDELPFKNMPVNNEVGVSIASPLQPPASIATTCVQKPAALHKPRATTQHKLKPSLSRRQRNGIAQYLRKGFAVRHPEGSAGLGPPLRPRASSLCSMDDIDFLDPPGTFTAIDTSIYASLLPELTDSHLPSTRTVRDHDAMTFFARGNCRERWKVQAEAAHRADDEDIVLNSGNTTPSDRLNVRRAKVRFSM